MKIYKSFILRHCFNFVAFVALGFATSMARAADSKFPAQARLFVAYPSINPTNINADLSAAGLKAFDKILHGGVEITTPVLPFLNVGFRYSPRLAYAVENPSNPATEYSAGIVQQAMLGVLRIHALRSAMIRLDGFVGVGGASTSFKIKTDVQDGSLSPASLADWFTYPMYSYGVSAGVGYEKFFLYVEGAYEKNKISGLVPTGTISSVVKSIDLSGYYVAVGIMFDGIEATSK